MQVIVIRPLSQTAKTSPSHGEDMGSIPVGVTKRTSSPLLLCKIPFTRLVCSRTAVYILRAVFVTTVEGLLFLLKNARTSECPLSQRNTNKCTHFAFIDRCYLDRL